MTIISSAVLFRGFGSSNPTVIITVCLGFFGTILCLLTVLMLVICGGVILLQLAKAADKVSDTVQLSSGLDDVKAITDVEKAEDEPGADAIRGALSIRRFSTVRRASRATSVDTGNAVPLPNWRRGRDGQSEWSRRESTIREVPSEEERKSSIHFDPTAPVTHIYPPRQPSFEKVGEDDHVEEIEMSRYHHPLSPVRSPDFLSTAPSTRYKVGSHSGIQKQFSFGRAGRKHLTEEETMGLVAAGQHEAVEEEEHEDRDDSTPHSDHSEDNESVESGRYGTLSGRGTQRDYDDV